MLGGHDIGMEFNSASNELRSGGVSDARWIKGLDLSKSFVGSVQVDDLSNSSDESGVIAENPGPWDWTSFENPYRVWARGAVLFGMRESQGLCRAGSGEGNCRIYDWSLHSLDRQILSQFHGPAETHKRLIARALASEEGIAGEVGDYPCGLSASAASQILMTQSSVGVNGGGQPVQTYLAAAVERLDDEVGDGDGLCETGERCIVLSQPGTDLGFGELKTCATRGVRGSLFDVELLKYEFNGR